MIAVVLAGGSGTRLWPLSRYTYPKQFIKLEGKTLLLRTLERVCHVNPDLVVIVANKEYEFLIKEELEKIHCDNEVLFESSPKNTAPAMALAVNYLRKKGTPDDSVIFLFPSDHIISPVEKFAEDIRIAEALAKKGFIATFGIKPKHPETGFGYIEVGEMINNRAFRVKTFREKPDIKLAVEYLKSGKYLWNSGMFAFRIDTILEEMKNHSPDIYKVINNQEDVNFDNMPTISIDYAVMEKTNKAVVVESSFDWSDVGSWNGFYNVLDKKDANGNVISGNVVSLDSKNSLFISEGKLTVAIGLEECVVITTPDAVFVSPKSQAERVKEAVSTLKEQGRREIIEHRTVYRPWGSYTVLEEGERYKIKRITIKPGASLSLQMHYHRSEHWVVVKGTARVVLENREMVVHEDESFYVPKSKKHRLENPGKIPTEIIEVQTGEYLGEDDIVRFEDVYGRR